MIHSATGEELWQWRQSAQQQAIAAGVPPAEVDWLLQSLSSLDRLSLKLESFRQREAISLQVSLQELSDRWQQRIDAAVPVQYLAGVVPWRQFQLRVSPAVLIPRPETELIIDRVAEAIHESPELATGHWADLGTGSGAIAIGLADLMPNATIHAVDQSESALAIARQNATECGFGDRIQFYHGSWFEPLHAYQRQLCGMVSNPPYIPSSVIPTLQPEVVRHEPHAALDGGSDGLDCIRQLVDTAPIYLKPNGLWLIEMMAGQSQAIATLLQQNGSYTAIKIHNDLAGFDRFALAYCRGSFSGGDRDIGLTA